jgi:hypothetical protein
VNLPPSLSAIADRSRRFVLLRRNVLVALVIAGACNPQRTPSPRGTPIRDEPGSVSYRYASNAACNALIDKARQDTASGAIKAASDCAHIQDLKVKKQVMAMVRSELRRLGEVAMDIPEFHDEQRLAGDAANSLGPLAGVYASPYLGQFTQPWQMRGQGTPGVLAGLIVVVQQDNESLPQSYKDLKFQFGVNCIYLEAKAGGYDAWVVQPEVDQPCRDETGNVTLPAGLLPLQVNIRQTGFSQSDMIPAARFLEDTQGRTVFGLPCLRAWCEVGIPGFTSVQRTYCDWFTGNVPAVPCPTNREGVIPSWYDEQRLENRSGTTWTASDIRGAIVPQPGIADHPASFFRDVLIHVANVYISDHPAVNGKLWKRGLRKGENKIELTHSTAQGWHYKVTAQTYPLNAQQRLQLKPWRVLGPHKHYDAPVPGTTRWRFTVADPGIWGPCGGLCCDGDGIQ